MSLVDPSSSKLILFGAVLLVLASVAVSFAPLFQQVSNALLDDTCGVYCRMAANYGTYLFEANFDKYYFQKSAPSAVLSLVHFVFDIPTDPASINRSFDIMRNVALAATIIVWFLICRIQSVNSRIFLVGVVALSVNQLMLFDAPFIHEDPDPFSVLVSSIFIYLCLCGRIFGMYVCIIFISFIQPQCALLMMPIFLLHPVGMADTRGQSWAAEVPQMFLRVFSRVRLRLSRAGINEGVVWGGLFLAWFFLCIYFIPSFYGPYIFHGGAGVSVLLAPFGAIGAAVFMSFALTRLRMLDAIEYLIVGLANSAVRRRLAAIVVLKLVVAFIVAYFGRGEVASITSSTFGTIWLIYTWFFQGAQQPLEPWFAHLVYFGPVFLLVVIFWSRLVHFIEILQIGAGANISLGLLVILSINSESRHFVAFVPFLLSIILCGVGRSSCPFDLRIRTWMSSAAFVSTFLILAIATSRVFLSAGIGSDGAIWLATWGPWWTWEQYYMSAIIGVFAASVVVVVQRLLSRP